jgi:hypothetical protein
MFQFAEAETRDRVLAAAGFTAIAGRDLDIRWRAARPEAIGRLLKEGMVRTRLLFERQTPAVQDRILPAVIDEARAFATAAGVEIPNAAHLATAVKPSWRGSPQPRRFRRACCMGGRAVGLKPPHSPAPSS